MTGTHLLPSGPAEPPPPTLGRTGWFPVSCHRGRATEPVSVLSDRLGQLKNTQAPTAGDRQENRADPLKYPAAKM